MKGRLVTFEGGEGSGKTTIERRIHKWIEEAYGVRCYSTRQPGGTKLGGRIRDLLLTNACNEPLTAESTAIGAMAELFLYMADRAQHIEQVIKPKLDAGWLVLCDRYIDSTVAYQGYGRGVDVTTIKDLNYTVCQCEAWPYLTIWLDVKPEVGLARTIAQKGSGFDRIEDESLEFHKRMRNGYSWLRMTSDDRIVQVDANQSIDKVEEEVRIIINERLASWLKVAKDHQARWQNEN
jgi:dTMP kinase